MSFIIEVFFREIFPLLLCPFLSSSPRRGGANSLVDWTPTSTVPPRRAVLRRAIPCSGQECSSWPLSSSSLSRRSTQNNREAKQPPSTGQSKATGGRDGMRRQRASSKMESSVAAGLCRITLGFLLFFFVLQVSDASRPHALKHHNLKQDT